MDQPAKRKRKVAAPQPAEARVKRSTSRIPGPPQVRPVAVHGMFVDNALAIPRTVATLHLMPGRLDNGNDADPTKVLVPFAEVRLAGGLIGEVGSSDDDGESDGEQLRTLFEHNLPLENLAFVLLDLTSDLRRMCREITELADAKLAVDPARMGVARYFVAHLERQAHLCRLQLDNFYPPDGAEDDLDKSSSSVR